MESTRPLGMNLDSIVGERSMALERSMRAIAGSFIIASLALGYAHSAHWHLFTAFVGLNLLQSASTRWCPGETLLVKSGLSHRSAG